MGGLGEAVMGSNDGRAFKSWLERFAVFLW